MFDRTTDYPRAVTSGDEAGLAAAIEWCADKAEDGDVISVWTSLVSNLSNSPELEHFVRRYSDVEHLTGRGSGHPSGPGPVLMAWPDMASIGELLRFAPRIRALCVVSWNDEQIRPWVDAAHPELLGDASAWETPATPLDPIVVEALRSMTLTINHNNTIKAGYEKDQVVGILLALSSAGIPMDSEAMEGWALAHGSPTSRCRLLDVHAADVRNGSSMGTDRLVVLANTTLGGPHETICPPQRPGRRRGHRDRRSHRRTKCRRRDGLLHLQGRQRAQWLVHSLSAVDHRAHSRQGPQRDDRGRKPGHDKRIPNLPRRLGKRGLSRQDGPHVL